MSSDADTSAVPAGPSAGATASAVDKVEERRALAATARARPGRRADGEEDRVNWVAAARGLVGQAAGRARSLRREQEQRCRDELRRDPPMWRG